MKKILYGICGIGNGHLYRQLPVLTHFLNNDYKVMVFAYGNSYDYLIKHYDNETYSQKIKIVKVCVPYYIGKKDGLDFEKTVLLNKNCNIDLNLEAFAQAQLWLGIPDLVISDYEPNSVQYGYAHDSKIITLDQQSKYFIKNLPREINGTNCDDETMRLKMFFPIVEQRLACSFFNIENSENKQNVQLIGPLIRQDILNIKREPNKIKNEYVVYLSAQEGLQQSLYEIITILRTRKESYHIFVSLKQYNLLKEMHIIFFNEMKKNNIRLYIHGDNTFEKLLETCKAIITTAGHTLLSEAMYLKIPVYALTLPLYEQQLSAYVISQAGFGIQNDCVLEIQLEHFINNIKKYENNIMNDQTILLKNMNKIDLVRKIEELFV